MKEKKKLPIIFYYMTPQSREQRLIRRYQHLYQHFEHYSVNDLEALLVQEKSYHFRFKLFSGFGISVLFTAMLGGLGEKLYHYVQILSASVVLKQLSPNQYQHLPLRFRVFNEAITSSVVTVLILGIVLFVICCIVNETERYTKINLLQSIVEHENRR